MNAEEFEKQMRESMEARKGVIAPLPVAPTEDHVAKHIKRVRDYALSHPCVFDEDFIRVFGEGQNRALFYYTKSWLVSVIVSVCSDDSNASQTLFWQVSTSLVSAFNGKPRSVGLLGGKEREQLIKSRDIVIRDVSELAADGGWAIEEFQQKTAFHACCDLTDEEMAISVSNMTDEQKAKLGR